MSWTVEQCRHRGRDEKQWTVTENSVSICDLPLNDRSRDNAFTIAALPAIMAAAQYAVDSIHMGDHSAAINKLQDALNLAKSPVIPEIHSNVVQLEAARNEPSFLRVECLDTMSVYVGSADYNSGFTHVLQLDDKGNPLKDERGKLLLIKSNDLGNVIETLWRTMCDS